MRFRGTYAHTVAYVPSRDELPALLNRRGLVGSGAEIGVKHGKYSDYLLSRWRGAKLISIDPWLADDPNAYVDNANVEQSNHEQFFSETQRRLARHGARSEIWRTTSVEAAARVADGSLDFAFIDARHDYASVLEDLHAWYSKVRPGGILAGHDYVDGPFPAGVFGVRAAVDEFLGERGIPVHSTRGRAPVETFPSWLAVIPVSAATGTVKPAAPWLRLWRRRR